MGFAWLHRCVPLLHETLCHGHVAFGSTRLYNTIHTSATSAFNKIVQPKSYSSCDGISDCGTNSSWQRCFSILLDSFYLTGGSSSDHSFQQLLKLTDVNKLKENITARQMELDLSGLLCRIQQLQQLERKKIELEHQKRENAAAVKQLMKGRGFQEVKVEKDVLIKRGKALRSELKQLMNDEYQHLYDAVMTDVLKLPTSIHPSTPAKDKVLEEIGNKRDTLFKPQTHIALGKKLNALYSSRVSDGTYYLVGDLALLEQQLVGYVTDCLRSSSFQQLTSPDIVKSAVAVGCGVNPDETYGVESKIESNEDSSAIPPVAGVDHQSLLLTGVSCTSFAAYLSSAVVIEDVLPIKYFSTGRSYSPGESVAAHHGLYAVSQATTIDIFGAGRNLQEVELLFDSSMQIIREIYLSLDLAVKFVQPSANGLRPSESKRVDVFVWSVALKNYFKSGELRLYNDYISQRLAVKYSADCHHFTASDYLYLFHGAVLKVPTVVAALVERHQGVVNTFSR